MKRRINELKEVTEGKEQLSLLDGSVPVERATPLGKGTGNAQATTPGSLFTSPGHLNPNSANPSI